jgi:hypothetical protein
MALLCNVWSRRGCVFLSFLNLFAYLLQTLGEVFNYIFDGISERYAREVEIVGAQYPIAPLKYLRNPLRISYAEGIGMLKVCMRVSSVCRFIYLSACLSVCLSAVVVLLGLMFIVCVQCCN